MEEFEQANHVLEQTLKDVETPRKRLRPESPSSKSRPCKMKRNEDDGKQSSSGGGLSDKDDLILEAFEDNVTLAETFTTDHPDLTNEEINIEKAFLSKTLVHLSSNNVKLRSHC